MSCSAFMKFNEREREDTAAGGRPPMQNQAKPNMGFGANRSTATNAFGTAPSTTTAKSSYSLANRAPSVPMGFDDDLDDKPFGRQTSNPMDEFIKQGSPQRNSGPTVDRFLGGGGSSSFSKPATGSPGGRGLAREAYRRIQQFMMQNEVQFNGAGEDGLPRIEQAWNVRHLKSSVAAANEETLLGIADILREYPGIHCVVHGETGRAMSAPEPLARFLRLDRSRDVKKCMDYLAEKRALACLEELVRLGIPRHQLGIQYKALGGNAQVAFVIDSVDEPPPAPIVRDVDRGEIDRLTRERDALQKEVDELKRKLRLESEHAGDFTRLKAAYDKATAELKRLQAAQASFEQRVQAEVARRVEHELQQARRRHEEEARRLKGELDRLQEENRRLRHDVSSRPQQVVTSNASLDLVDILPAGLELSSLKRAEWRRLFERIVAELLRRKKTTTYVQPAPAPDRYSRYDSYSYDVKSQVDRLWERSSYRPPPPPIPPPPPPAAPPAVTADADEFLGWRKGGAADADAFLASKGGRSTDMADAFINRAPTAPSSSSTTNLASDAGAFLASVHRKPF